MTTNILFSLKANQLNSIHHAGEARMKKIKVQMWCMCGNVEGTMADVLLLCSDGLHSVRRTYFITEVSVVQLIVSSLV
jgi:hypothetical protein